MLVIASDDEPVAVVVMGGKNSGVDQRTKRIVLESANFEATSVRKTSQALALRTESSMRFEKSLDPNMTDKALARVLEIIKETCPKAKFDSALFDKSDFKLDLGPIKFNREWLNKKIGEELDNTITKVLKSLGFGVEQG